MSPSIPARGLLALIQLYQWTLSPIVGRDCRYLPTCSSYAADAIRAHGAWAGGWMATARICRCHPWGGDGWDPAPEKPPRAPWYAPWKLGDWKRGYRAPPQECVAPSVLSREGEVAAGRPTERAAVSASDDGAASLSVTLPRDSSPTRESTASQSES